MIKTNWGGKRNGSGRPNHLGVTRNVPAMRKTSNHRTGKSLPMSSRFVMLSLPFLDFEEFRVKKIIKR
jgi:hypothetical protein